MSEYLFLLLDSETTSLSTDGDVIELSLSKIVNDGENIQKTWFLRPLNPEAIQATALKINGHNLEDLLHKTKEGGEKYLEPSKVIIEIENWIAQFGYPTEKVFLIGQNIQFDKNFMESLWTKCNAKDSFPFGRRSMDTMGIELFFDFCKESFAEGYSLKNLTKKYGVVNAKAHSAESDVKATGEVFEKQVSYFKKLLTNQK